MLALYLKLIGARIRAQMQYKTSFTLELLAFALVTGLEFLLIPILFTRFPSLAGWKLAEVALLYGMTSLPFGLAEMIGRGFDAPFEVMMQRGTFDTVLTRPLGSFFQILASDFQLRRLGRSFQGVAVLVYAFPSLSITWTPAKLVLLLLTVVCGVVIYLSLMVINATICFWTIKTPEVMNIFTFGGDYLVSFPLSIYSRAIRNIFLFVIPVAFVNYPTVLYVLERNDPFGSPASLAWAAPLAALLFFAVARGIWHVGVTKYASTGS